jgi:hypothetical protein
MLITKTRHLIQSRTAVVLKVTYSDLYKINKLQIEHKLAAVHEELDDMNVSDSDSNPVDDEGNNIPPPEHHLINIPEHDAINNVDTYEESS